MRTPGCWLACSFVAFALVSCSGETTVLDQTAPSGDSGAEGSQDAGPDATSESSADAAFDAAPDGQDGSEADAAADGAADAHEAGADVDEGGALGPVGAACTVNAACEGGFCLAASIGFPDGYCSHMGCDTQAAETSCLAFGGDGICIEAGQGTNLCFDRCDLQAPDCRTGYHCTTVAAGVSICLPEPVCGNGKVEVGEECEPPNTPACGPDCQGLGTAPVGDPCAAAADCAGNYCIGEWPDGYCTQSGCDLSTPETACKSAGGDGLCWDVGDPSTPFGICLDRCQPASSDCRTGYQCVPAPGGIGLCIPEPVCGNGEVEAGEECEPPNTSTCDANCLGLGELPVGAPCSAATECAGNLCFSEWPDGYCTQSGCDLSSPETACQSAGGDGICWDVGDPGSPLGICLDRCQSESSDCRTGYQCVPAPGGIGLCLPEPVCGNGDVETGEECEPPNSPTCDANCQGTGQLAAGKPCQDAAECAGNLCIAGWPGGYCSQYGCDLSAQGTSCAAAGGDALCVDVGDAGSPLGLCLDRCVPLTSDCRTGYECMRIGLAAGLCIPTPVCGNGAIERGEECEPPGVGACDANCQGPGTASTGTPCTSPMECAGNLCLPDAGGWAGGYCSQADCDPLSLSSCVAYGAGSVCGVLDLLGAVRVVCLDGCGSTSDCRAGYQCQWVGIGGNGCVPQ